MLIVFNGPTLLPQDLIETEKIWGDLFGFAVVGFLDTEPAGVTSVGSFLPYESHTPSGSVLA